MKNRKTILLIGAGKSATVLIRFLADEAAAGNINLLIADADKEALLKKPGATSPNVTAVGINITDTDKRNELVGNADIVISMMPPALHLLIAKSCILHQKHLLTASYADDEMKALNEDAIAAKVLFLCEMGLDPGIDHMSALSLIDQLRLKNAEIKSFKSHCGGLVAPESDDNPWHYKISWNPRNVVLAGKAGAVFKFAGKEVALNYQELFKDPPMVKVEDTSYACYPNRNSIPYISLYGLQSCETFVRTTLRHPYFMEGWQHLVELGLTDETPRYNTEQMTIGDFFIAFFRHTGQEAWLGEKVAENFSHARSDLDKLEKEMQRVSEEDPDSSFFEINATGDLVEHSESNETHRLAGQVKDKMQRNNRMMEQLIYLGLNDYTTYINKGLCSAADVLQFILEKRLALKPGDKDLVVMLHEIEYILDGERKQVNSSLVVKGDDDLNTAMAKTVGMPLGIAAMLLAKGELKLSGVHVPVLREIYEPVLKELSAHGICFRETGL